MRIAIAGAGMAGTYLLKLLNEAGSGTVDLYDVKKTNPCGHRPCAWGFAPSREYRRLVGRFLEAEDYVLHASDRIIIDGVEVKADLLTVDKPSLIRDMIGDVEVRYGTIDPSSYDRVVDATGVNRAYLGPIGQNDYVADLCQHRVRSERQVDTWVRMSSAGYGWCFPLRDGEFHIGYGNLPPHFVDGKGAIEGSLDGARVNCTCVSRIRMASPFYSQPFVRDNVVGVGESIGTVGPMGGDGNLYSMQCAEMLARDWDDLEIYQHSVLKEFDWMRRERAALERVVNGSRPTPGDIRLFVQHCRRVGFGVGPVAAMKFLTRMGQ